MCRLAGLLTTRPGPVPPLSLLLHDPVHSLSQQSESARQMEFGHTNVDGTGVAWWAEDAPQPLRYVSDKPPWSDANLPWLAPRLRARCQVALVRKATVGIPHGTAFVSPFIYDRVACAHNGSIGDFRSRLARPLLARLPDHLFAAFHGASDSLALLLVVVAHLERDPAGGLVGAVAGALDEVSALALRHEAPSALNLLVGDGERLVAARCGVLREPPTLYACDSGELLPHGVLLASEELDDTDGWVALDPGEVVEVDAFGLHRGQHAAAA